MKNTTRAVYRVNVTRERDAWLADVPDVAGAHTFARSLSALQRNVWEVIVLMTDQTDDALDLDLRYEIGDSSTAVTAARPVSPINGSHRCVLRSTKAAAPSTTDASPPADKSARGESPRTSRPRRPRPDPVLTPS
ncbi:hypothetical protein [Frankia sp. Cas3]|uniref:type II toxin-antitoxin system HicB family antitoxin n=1 Tax=Frankia sp. Cas3 TaxID=3073926 RepID=UPI002AD422E4|nr:hypothetical protein [Frankia sp. Cas3]